MIPLWLKIAWTVMVCVIVPLYWRNYGPANLLWFSDIALILTTVALWTENRLIASMMAVAVLVPEIVWNISYFGRLLTGYPFAGIAGYMWDTGSPLFMRGLSLFHIVLPVVLVWLVWRLGYDWRAFPAMVIMAWMVLVTSYFVSTASANLNWVFGIGTPQKWMHPLAWLGLLMIMIPAAVYVPTHLILRALFTR